MNEQYYRLCPLGHKVICPNSLVRPPCRICGQPVSNQSPLRILGEEVEEPVAARQEQPAEPVQEPQVPVASEPVDPEPGGYSADDGNRRRRAAVQTPEPAGEISGLEGRRRRAPVMTAEPEPVSVMDNRRRRTAEGPVRVPGPAAAVRAEQEPTAGAVRLDLFGMTITVPAEGGFLGRDGIGAQQLEGFLLVSRQHVYVKPDRAGRLMVEDRGSTNGTWFTHADHRQRLELGRTEILEAGDILWLYNIPLKVVT